MLSRGVDTEVGRVLTMEVAGMQGKERLSQAMIKRRLGMIAKGVMGLEKGMASNRETWRRRINEPVNPH